METDTKHRRSRKRPQITTGIIRHTEQDARGLCEPLSRYGELTTEILGDFYNLANGNAPTSLTYKRRLTDLVQESVGFTASRRILDRPAYQWRHGINHQTIYRKTLGTSLTLFRFGLYTEEMLRWANTTQIVQLAGDHPPSDHDAALSIVAASIELEARKKLRFITHIDILKNASEEAKAASSPLSIPVPLIKHRISTPNPDPKGKPVVQEIVRKELHVKPDALFGIQYSREDYKFFVLEYDRSTEDMEPTKNLTRASWLKKILCYSAISQRPNPVYTTYLKVPNLQVLCVFPDTYRMQHAIRLVKKYAAYPAQFRFMVVPPIDPLLDARLLPRLFRDDWQGVDGTFNLSTGK